MLDRKVGVEMPLVIIGKGLAQFGDACLPRVEGLAIGKAVAGRVADKIGRGQITLACPQRNNTLLSPAMIHYGNDAAFWRNSSFMTQMLDKTHSIVLR